MAAIVVSTIPDDYDCVVATWSALGNADTGNSAKLLRWARKFIHVTGTFGGATVTVQVSNDNTNWLGATSDGTTALTFTAAGIKQIFEEAAYFRVITAGGAGTSLTAIMVGAPRRGM
jgi:hypothetical protein